MMLRIYIREPNGSHTILVTEPECTNYDTGTFLLTKSGKISKKLVIRVETIDEDLNETSLPW